MSTKIYIIGMHRSGTSLTANWLGECGLHLGFDLIGATPSNLKGHFEDLDILEFHEKLLRYNEITFYVGTGIDANYSEYHMAKARSLIYLRDQFHDLWGWKQCRAVLFLDLWREVSPEAKYFIVFRHPLEVVNSLFVRQLNKLKSSNDFATRLIALSKMKEEANVYYNRYFDMYCRYNMDILDHINKIDNNNYLLIEIDKLIKRSDVAIDFINNAWEIDLNKWDIKNIYTGNIHHKQRPNFKINKYQKKALSIYEDLKNKSTF